MYRFEEIKTNRNKLTRVCIGESLINLMQNTDFEKIQIKDVAKKAGVSRMTFYHYYETKEDVLADFIYEIMGKYYELLRKENRGSMYTQNNVEIDSVNVEIQFAMDYFSKFDIVAQMLSKHNLDGFVLKTMNDYVDKKFVLSTDNQKKKAKFVAAGIYNTLLN